jgi:hypothetical protein
VIRWLPVLLGLLLAGSPLAAQDVETNGSRPKVFFDCQGRNCNSEYYRTEIDWVDWVRDRNDSDVHLILTSQTTGAGGREYLFDFIGEGDHTEYTNQLHFQSSPTDTNREVLDGITYTLSLGLAHFGAAEGFGQLIDIEGTVRPGFDPATRVVSAEEVDDPWNLWVFRISGNANLNGEETRTTKRVNGGFNASRVTPTWKLNFNGNVNFSQREIELTDSPDFTDKRTDWGLSQLVAYSLADHWSVGARGNLRKQTNVNQNLRVEITPSIEYSYFPYEEATRRSLTALYSIGPGYRDYIEETVFGETSETRFEHAFTLQFSQRQPWGNAGITVRGSQYLHDLDLYNFSMRGNVNFRIVRGLSVNARGNIAWVNDQIYLSAEGVSDEEALLNLQRQNQNFTYGVQVGFSFQFGSIYNNVVNNRFDRFGRGFGS